MAYIGKSPTGTGVRSRYYYTATGGETSLSGADDNSNTLVFSDGNYVDVSLNGIALVAGTDYNTSTANTIAGLSALSASDIVEIVVYDIFTVADTVSAKDGGTFSGNVAMGGTLSVTGAATATGGLNVGTIKDSTGTNTALSINSSGHVTMPNKPFVSAAWDGSSGDVVGGLFRYTTYETADHNLVSGNHKIFYKNDFNMLNTSTGVVTPPVTGIYLIVGHYADETGATAARSIGALWKGGVYLGEYQESYGQYDDQSAVRLLYLTPSDTIQFGHNSGFPYDDFGFEMVLVG